MLEVRSSLPAGEMFFPFFGCFVFVLFFFTILFSYFLAGSNLFTLLPFLYTFAGCCDKRISSSYC